MEPPIEPPPQPPPPPLSPPPPSEPVPTTVPSVPVPESTIITPLAMDNSHFLGSIMEEGGNLDATSSGVVVGALSAAEVTEPVKKRRGRPPKNGGAPKSGGAAKSSAEGKMGSSRKRKRDDEEEEEVVCFICFDGGNLVVCDKRGCPKVYHPACIHRDEAFFKTRGKWNCGWHICSMCQKNSQYMCYTCSYSSCRGCLKNAKFFRVRGNKGFCDTCFGTIVLIEDIDQEKKVAVDFDDKNSWEYLFKLYWVELKENLSLTIEELKTAKDRWDPNVVSTSKTDSTDDSYDAYSDLDASSDGSSGRRKKGNRGRKRGRKSTKSSTPGSGRPAQKAHKNQVQIAQDLTPVKEIEIKVMPFPEGTEWATPDMLEFVGHMRDGNRSYVSQYDVQALVLDYIKKNNLRDPRKKSQIICDSRLLRLFGKPRVGHLEMLKLIEMHFLVKETSQAITNDGNNLNLGQVENGVSGDMMPKSAPNRRKKRQKIPDKAVDVNIGDYAAIDMHNIGLVYLRRGLMEELIDDVEKFKEKVVGAFVRIRIPGVVQKQDMYRLVKVVGTSKATEKYKVGKKMTDIMLEILNLDKKEIITADAISNQEFSEEECNRLRQSIKCGLMAPLKVGEIQEKGRSLQFLRINELLENEKQRLSHLRDRASETGRRKELRECVEKLQILNTPEERERRLHEVPIVHSDPQMDPACKSGDVPTAEAHKPDRGRNKSGSREPGSRRRGREAKDPSGSTSAKQSKNNGEIGTSANLGPQFGVPPESAASSELGGEKVWHYRDPMGNIQGPFSIHQLAKWSSYFPPTLKVWLMIDSEENSLLLTDILPKNLKVSAETKPTDPITVAGGNGANASNAGFPSANSAKLPSTNYQAQPQSQVSTSSAAATIQDSGKVAQANSSSNSIKEYGSIWSPTKSSLGSSSQQSRNNLKEKPMVPSVSAPAPSSSTAPGSQNSCLPAPTPEKIELKSSSSPSTASVSALNPELVPDTNNVRQMVKAKEEEKQVNQAVSSLNTADSIAPTTTLASMSHPAPAPAPTPAPTTLPAPMPAPAPTPTPVPVHPSASPTPPALTPTPSPPPTSSSTTTATITSTITATTTAIATTMVHSNSPEKDKNQHSENEYPSPTPPTSDSPIAEPDDAPDESWPEVQVHESTGVEPWVPDPTTTSLDTGTSYPSDCLSPADILLSLSRVADEDLEDGDFLARMEALKKKSRLSDREERPVVGPGVLDLSVAPVDGASLQETAECSQENKSAIGVQKEAKPTTTGGEVLFLQTDPMRTNSWDKLADPLGADWSLPSPTPLATKTSGLCIDGISPSGHVAESVFISGAHQRAVATNPEPSVVMERTTYMDLNTTLQGSIGTSDMAPSPVNDGVTWSSSALQGGMNTTDVSHVTPVSANAGISWNMGAVDASHAASASANTGVTWSSTTMHGNMNPNPSDVRSPQANTGVTWSTLSGSATSAPAPQPKAKPYNSWAEAIHPNSTNLGWAASVHTNSNIRTGWGAPAPTPHANLSPNPATIPEQRKEVATDPNASWGTTLALGNNTQSHWETGAANGVDWAGQWNRSGWHGGGSQSRPQPQPSRGQAYQRVICKFYENGNCKKGASCNYMHR